MLKTQYVRSNVQGALCKMQCVNGSASQTSWTDQLDGPAGRTSWTYQLEGPAGRTSWTDQLDGPAGPTGWTDQLDGPVLFIWSLGQFAYSKIFLSVCTLSQLPSPTKAFFKYSLLLCLPQNGCNEAETWKKQNSKSHIFTDTPFRSWGLYLLLNISNTVYSSVHILCRRCIIHYITKCIHSPMMAQITNQTATLCLPHNCVSEMFPSFIWHELSALQSVGVRVINWLRR